MESGQRVTIYDVARAANVAPSTVSRAISQPSRVNEATVRKIREHAARLGYVLNRTARGLSTGRTGNLAMVVPNIGNPFFIQFMRAFHQQAHQLGYSVYLIDSGEDAAEEVRRIDGVRSQVDGIVLVSPRMGRTELERVTEKGRFVVVNRRLESQACVWIDSSEALAQVFDDLSAWGHRSVVYARGPVGGYSDSIRRTVARRLAVKAGIELLTTPAQRDEHSGAIAALDLAEQSGATALLAHSDAAAVGVLSQCRQLGVEVPLQLSVIGHDDIDWASIVHPALTTISGRAQDTGQWSAHTLIESIEAPDGAAQVLAQHSIAATYVRRDSAGPVS